jgi:hypothetical protein
MNVDLTNVFQEARQNLNTWSQRYSSAEYPYKVILNIFYRKYAMESMFGRVLRLHQPNLDSAMRFVAQEYQNECAQKIVHVSEQWMKSNRKVGMLQYSDFESYIRSAAQGNQEAIQGIEYTYKLHRIIDGLIWVWMSIVTTGASKLEAVTKVTNAVLAPMPIDNYETIESILDQLGAENYLRQLIIKEMSGKL